MESWWHRCQPAHDPLKYRAKIRRDSRDDFRNRMRELLMENTAREDLTVRSNPRVEFRKDSRKVHGFASSHGAENHFPWGLQFSFPPFTLCHDTVLHLRSRSRGHRLLRHRFDSCIYVLVKRCIKGWIAIPRIPQTRPAADQSSSINRSNAGTYFIDKVVPIAPLSYIDNGRSRKCRRSQWQ